MKKCIPVDCYGDIFITSESDNNYAVRNEQNNFLFFIRENKSGAAVVKETYLCDCPIFYVDILPHILSIQSTTNGQKQDVDVFWANMASKLKHLPAVRKKYGKQKFWECNMRSICLAFNGIFKF